MLLIAIVLEFVTKEAVIICQNSCSIAADHNTKRSLLKCQGTHVVEKKKKHGPSSPSYLTQYVLVDFEKVS